MKQFNSPFPIVACSVFFLLLIVCLLAQVNQALFLKLNNVSQIFPDNAWGFLTTLSDPVVAPLLVFSLFNRNQLFLRAFFITLILALLSNYALKHGFGFERPSALLAPATFNMIGPDLTSPSFPSGHTLTIFSLMGLVSAWYQKRTVSITVLFIAALISFARISVGAHWPSDVLFGALVGCVIGWLAVEIHSRLDKTIPEKLVLSACFIVLFSGILSLISKTPYPSGQWLSTAASLFAIAYALRSITELLHRQKG